MSMSDEQLFDPWKFESGGMDAFEGTIKSGSFVFNTAYAPDALQWVAEFVLDNGAPWTESYSVGGKEWTTNDEGRTAVRRDGSAKNFTKTAFYGRFVGAAMDAGAEDVLRKSGKTPMDASLFDGLRFRLEKKEFNFGGEIGKKEKLMPVAFLGGNGEGGGQGGYQPTTADSPGPKEELARSTRIQLEELAGNIKAEGGTHDDFVRRGFMLPGVDGNDAAEAAVLQPGAVWDTVEVTASGQ